MRHLVARLPVHALALLLVFKAAVPMLASVAASAQGRSVGEICSVYGVVLPTPAQAMATPHESDSHAHHHAGHDPGIAPAEHSAPGDPGSRHGADHCALTALATLASGDDPPARLVAFTTEAASPPAPAAVPRRDAVARWAARLGHGPPVFS